MSEILLKNVTVADPASTHNGRQTDILISNGIIKNIGNDIDNANAEVFSGEGIYAAPGFMDLRANFWDPGQEQKEDIFTGCEAAAYGGFTTVALLPETEPVVSGKSQVEYIKSKAGNTIVDVLPLGSIAPDKEQKSISEMYELAEAGALALTSGYRPVEDRSFLLHAMEYAAMFNKKLMLYSQNKSLTAKGMVNEGEVSVQLGIKSVPAMAEAMEVSHIIMLCRYSGLPVHISCISTADAVMQIKDARNQGLPITADVSIQHLFFNETALLGFDPNFKMRPPLRTEADRQALQQALLEEDFLTVVSDHTPHEQDRKMCEFELAAYGTSSIQTVFSQLLHIYGAEKMPQLINILAYRPRMHFGLQQPTISEGNKANITLFSTTQNWQLNAQTNRSKSQNSPLWGQQLTGRAVALVNKSRLKVLN